MAAVPTRPTEDELRSGLRTIAAWAEPAAAPPLPSATTVVLDGPRGPARPPWPRLAAAAIVVVVALAAGILVLGQRPAPVAEPGLDGVLDRLPGSTELLDVLDVAALRAVADGTDGEDADKAVVLLRQLELDPTIGAAIDETESLRLDIDAIRAVGRANVAPGIIVAVLATTQDPDELAAALRDAGFEEGEDGTFRRDASGDPGDLPARGAAASIEPGYLTVTASLSDRGFLISELPAGDELPAALRAVLSAAEPFLVLSARVDPSAGVAAMCGGAEAVTYGPDGYALVLLRGGEGRVVADPEREPGLFGQGRAGATRSDGGVAVVEVVPGEFGRVSTYPVFALSGDFAPLVDC